MFVFLLVLLVVVVVCGDGDGGGVDCKSYKHCPQLPSDFDSMPFQNGCSAAIYT